MKDLFGGSIPQRRTQQKDTIEEFFIYGDIEDAIDYVDLVTVLDAASPTDEVNIHINTDGGNLDTTIVILHAILRSEGIVIAHADGTIASAGTLIFFACPNKIVYPYANFMFHDVSTMVGGKVNESMKSLEATTKLIKRITGDLYYPYFSREEIDQILEGKDFYCDSDEIISRLENVDENMESEVE